MATPDVTAGTVMTGSRALLNDQDDQIYHNANLLPYLKTAFRELRELLEESNVPVTNKTDTVLSIPASSVNTVLTFITTPALPDDLVEIQQVWYRQAGIDPWFPLTKREILPPQLEGIQYSDFLYWSWQNNSLHLLPCNQVMDLKLYYIQELSDIVDENSILGVINGQSFLEFRTAALAARFMSEDIERATDLDNNTGLAKDRLINIENKARQSISIRRRPFRAGWKSRTSV